MPRIHQPFDAPQKYNIIYADPPWRYYDKANAGNRGAGYKYDLMSDAEIKALPVKTIATEDAALFLWATFPKLPVVLEVMAAWGFEYKTVAFVWVKRDGPSAPLRWGMGNWTRANAEVCLLGTRGKPQRMNAGVHQVVEAVTAQHSEKPAEVRDRIVKLLGPLKRIELFARQEVEGWDCWGKL